MSKTYIEDNKTIYYYNPETSFTILANQYTTYLNNKAWEITAGYLKNNTITNKQFLKTTKEVKQYIKTLLNQ